MVSSISPRYSGDIVLNWAHVFPRTAIRLMVEKKIRSQACMLCMVDVAQQTKTGQPGEKNYILEGLASLDMMGTYLSAPLKPLNAIVYCDV